jgi:outer membrane receptor for ferrienterochelin and colicins
VQLQARHKNSEDHASLTGARTVIISQNLRPERSWNGNVNYTRKFFPAHASVISLDASPFYTYFTNQIIPDYDTDPNIRPGFPYTMSSSPES